MPNALSALSSKPRCAACARCKLIVQLTKATGQLSALQLQIEHGRRQLFDANAQLVERSERLARTQAELQSSHTALAGKNAAVR